MLTVREYLRENNPKANVFDGLDAAIIGVGNQYTKDPLVIYSASKIIDCYMKQGMTQEGAVEFYEYNCACVWCGEGTPIIMEDRYVSIRPKDDEHEPTHTIRRTPCSTIASKASKEAPYVKVRRSGATKPSVALPSSQIEKLPQEHESALVPRLTRSAPSVSRKPRRKTST